VHADAALDLQGGMMALVALRDAAAKVFRLTTAGRLIAVFRTVAEVAARD
jgi:anti-anti-sigma regulatory factor